MIEIKKIKIEITVSNSNSQPPMVKDSEVESGLLPDSLTVDESKGFNIVRGPAYKKYFPG